MYESDGNNYVETATVLLETVSGFEEAFWGDCGNILCRNIDWTWGNFAENMVWGKGCEYCGIHCVDTMSGFGAALLGKSIYR